jgi:hypothetical protein
VEVEMARAEAAAALWRDGDLIGQLAAVIVEDLQRAGVLTGGSIDEA